MQPKDRFISAMMFKQPDDYVAFMEIEFQKFGDFPGEFPKLGYEFDRLSPKEQEKAVHRNAEIMVEAAEQCGHDVIRSFGSYWERGPGDPALLWLPDEESQLKQLRVLKELAGDYYFIAGTVSGHMGIPNGGSMLEFSYRLFDEPAAVKDECANKLQNALEWGFRQVDAGADTVVDAVDVAFNSGPFLSPKQMDEFFFPYFDRWVDELASQGLLSIWHTDGDIRPILERIIQSGLTAVQWIDPQAGMDIVSVKKQVQNRLVVIGNIETALLQFGPVDAIEAEMIRVLEGCKGDGGFVLGSCNAVYPEIPKEHYQLMVDLRYRYGKERHQ